MNIIETLINTSKFNMARPIWEAGLAQAVFEPFFAYMVLNLNNPKEVVWHEAYTKHTKDTISDCLKTGVYTDELDVYWRDKHLLFKDGLTQHTAANETDLHEALPIAAFLAYQTLKVKAQAEQKSVEQFAQSLSHEALPYLPAWAETLMDEDLLAQLNVDNLLLNSLQETLDSPEVTLDDDTTDGRDEDGQADDDEMQDWQEVRDARRTNSLWIGGGVVALLALGLGGGYWYINKDKSTPATDPVQATPAGLVAQNRPAPTLSITVGHQGQLYACHARLGNNAQSDELVRILGSNFSSTLCVMDISEQVSQTMTGLDKLTSVLALLKTAPFATLEMSDNQVFINAPNPDDIDRLVRDIGALMTDMTVAKMPPLNATESVKQSLSKASNLLNAIADGANPYDLAYALSTQKIDTQSGSIPEINKALLALSAGKIAANPNARFIVVVHSDDIGDKVAARTQTQALADMIKAELVAQGASDGQLVAQGVGFDFPIADNQTDLGRFKNRRVEFLVYDESVMQALNPPQQPISSGGMPSLQGAQTTYTVIDGRIVEQGMLPPDMNAAEQMPVEQLPIPQDLPHQSTDPGDVTTNDVVTPEPIISISPANAPISGQTPAPAASTKSSRPAIPDELIAPIGSDAAGSGVQSSQILEVE